jgi:capsid assembly protease
MLNSYCGVPLALDREHLAYARGRMAGRVSMDLVAKLAANPEHSQAMVREVAGARIEQLGRVAIVPMRGIIVQRPDFWTRYGYDTSASQFAEINEALAADPTVGAIVWDVDSPGGVVAGVPEAFARLLALRGQKRIVAVANSMMASAAYWLSCAADEVVASPSALVGNIGIVHVHVDYSKANDMNGENYTYIYAGKNKVEGNPDTPLSDNALSLIQDRVDGAYAQFVKSVSQGRGVTPEAVRSGFGSGAVLLAMASQSAGLSDRVAPMSAVLKSLRARPDMPAAGMSAAMRQAMQRQAEAE